MEINRPEKPGVGSWTALHPQLGTGDVSHLDSISPEFFEKEKQAIFKRLWLNVGRVEHCPRWTAISPKSSRSPAGPRRCPSRVRKKKFREQLRRWWFRTLHKRMASFLHHLSLWEG